VRTWQWLAATAIASTIMMSSLFGFVYSRVEGDKLERRVELLEERIYRELQEIRRLILQKGP